LLAFGFVNVDSFYIKFGQTLQWLTLNNKVFALFSETEGVLPWLHDVGTNGPLTKVPVLCATSILGQMGQSQNVRPRVQCIPKMHYQNEKNHSNYVGSMNHMPCYTVI
jgi:hypothetical protein